MGLFILYREIEKNLFWLEEDWILTGNDIDRGRSQRDDFYFQENLVGQS